MYWWNAFKLAEDLREGRVDEKQRFKYFLATVVLWSVVALALIFSNVPFSTNALLSAAINLTLAVVGICLCYRVNKNGDNADFIPRFICLGWPVGVCGAAIFSSLVLIGMATSIPREMSGSPPLLSALEISLRRVWFGLGSYYGSGTLGFYFIVYCFIVSHYLGLAAKAKGAESPLESLKKPVPGWEIVFGIFVFIGYKIIGALGSSYIPNLAGLPALSDLLIYLADGLWLLLLACIWVLFFERGQSTNQA